MKRVKLVTTDGVIVQIPCLSKVKSNMTSDHTVPFPCPCQLYMEWNGDRHKRYRADVTQHTPNARSVTGGSLRLSTLTP